MNSISGYTLTGAQPATYSDPWSRLAAAAIKRAIHELLAARSESKANKIMEWLRSEEAAWFCDCAGINIHKVHQKLRDYTTCNKAKKFRQIRDQITKFDNHGTYGARRTL